MAEKNKKHVDLDKETQNDLKELNQTGQEIQMRMTIMVKMFLRGKGVKGNYRLSNDFTRLELIEK